MRAVVLSRSAVALATRVVLLLFLIDTIYALIILLFLQLAPPTGYYLGFIIFLWALHTAKYISITFLLLRVLLRWLGKSYIIDGKHLTVRTGIVSVSEKVYELQQLRELTVRQGWLGRLCHYGTLTLQLSFSGFRETLELEEIIDPRKYEAELAAEFV